MTSPKPVAAYLSVMPVHVTSEIGALRTVLSIARQRAPGGNAHAGGFPLRRHRRRDRQARAHSVGARAFCRFCTSGRRGGSSKTPRCELIIRETLDVVARATRVGPARAAPAAVVNLLIEGRKSQVHCRACSTNRATRFRRCNLFFTRDSALAINQT